jgi:hypothetical protein
LQNGNGTETQAEADAPSRDAVFLSVLQPFNDALNGPTTRSIGQVNFEVDFALLIGVVSQPFPIPIPAQDLADIAPERENPRTQVRGKQSATLGSPFLALIVKEPINLA